MCIFKKKHTRVYLKKMFKYSHLMFCSPYLYTLLCTALVNFICSSTRLAFITCTFSIPT